MAPTRPSETGSDRARQAGFTLTELLVVLAIIGLMVAMIPVLLQSALPGTRSLAAARALASDLRAVRGAALAGGGTTAVRFEAAGQIDLLEPGDRRRTLPGGVPFALPQARPDAQIVFYPDGSSSGGTVFVGETTRRHRIAIDWLTGRVALDE